MGSYCLEGRESQFCKMGRILEIGSGDSYTTMWMQWMPLNCILKMARMVNFIVSLFYHN